jgi:hypothetical protein
MPPILANPGRAAGVRWPYGAGLSPAAVSRYASLS